MSSGCMRASLSACMKTRHWRPKRLNWFTDSPPRNACSVSYTSPTATPCLLRGGSSFTPRLQRDEIERRIVRRHARDEAEAGYRRRPGDAVGLAQDLLDPTADFIRSRERRGRRQLDVEEEETVVLLGHE